MNCTRCGYEFNGSSLGICNDCLNSMFLPSAIVSTPSIQDKVKLLRAKADETDREVGRLRAKADEAEAELERQHRKYRQQ